MINGIKATGGADKLYFFIDQDSSQYCISNTLLCILYTALSFLSICFVVIGRQVAYSKRNRGVYMDVVNKPEDSEQEDDDLEAEKIAFEMLKVQNAMAAKENKSANGSGVLEIVPPGGAGG